METYKLYIMIGFIGAFLLIGVLLILYFQSRKKIHTLERRYATLTRGLDGSDWSMMLENMSETMDTISKRQDNQEKAVTMLAQRMQLAYSKSAMVHYDAFDHIKGHLSFSLALLNDDNDGIIFTNIHGREDARCYLKEVKDGKIQTFSSEEELEALHLAIKQGE